MTVPTHAFVKIKRPHPLNAGEVIVLGANPYVLVKEVVVSKTMACKPPIREVRPYVSDFYPGVTKGEKNEISIHFSSSLDLGEFQAPRFEESFHIGRAHANVMDVGDNVFPHRPELARKLPDCISKKHAGLFFEDGSRWVLIDSSRNGTFLLINRYFLREGNSVHVIREPIELLDVPTEIMVGGHLLKFVVSSQ